MLSSMNRMVIVTVVLLNHCQTGGAKILCHGLPRQERVNVDENWCITALCEGPKEGECGWNLVYCSPSSLLSPVSTHEFVSQDFLLLTFPVCKDAQNASFFYLLIGTLIQLPHGSLLIS